jgi:steroid 5-alpha reductase family enzyme
MSAMLHIFLVGAIILFVVFTATWLVQLKTKNAGIVDPIWSLSFPVLATVYFLLSDRAQIKLLFVAMIVIWGIRLGIHLLTRVLKEEHEDVRYAALRKEWGEKQNIFMLRFYYFQGILAGILSIPFALVISNPNLQLTVFEISGIIIWIIAVIGESTADAQLRSFKADRNNRGKVCDRGLWYYSRHPNYFFEWLIWISFFVFSLGSPYGFVSIICPILMLYFLLKVTGIPYTEIQSVKFKGEPYTEYQRTTSAFVPLPKRNRHLALS